MKKDHPTPCHQLPATHLHPVEVSSSCHFKDVFPIDVEGLHLTNEGRDGARGASSRWGVVGTGVIAHHSNVDVSVL